MWTASHQVIIILNGHGGCGLEKSDRCGQPGIIASSLYGQGGCGLEE